MSWINWFLLFGITFLSLVLLVAIYQRANGKIFFSTNRLESSKIEKSAVSSADESFLVAYSSTLPADSSVEELETEASSDNRIIEGGGTRPSETLARESYSADEVQKALLGQPSVLEGQKIVFLTFDDGANSQLTPKILDVLAQYQIPATFFIVGNTVNTSTAPILQRELAEGHTIGVHSFSHRYEVLYPNRIGNTQAIWREILETQQALRVVLGQDFVATVFRYPGGHMSWQGLATTDQQLEAHGITWIDWNASVGDAEPLGECPTTVVEMLAYQKESFYNSHSTIKVVLMHDSPDKEVTLASLPGIIRFYQSQGYRFAKFS